MYFASPGYEPFPLRSHQFNLRVPMGAAHAVK